MLPSVFIYLFIYLPIKSSLSTEYYRLLLEKDFHFARPHRQMPQEIVVYTDGGMFKKNWSNVVF